MHSQALTLDVAGLRAALAIAPLETRAAAPLVLALPLPDGGTARFAVREAPVMEPALAAQFPNIKTYAGVGLDDAAASVRLDLSPQGFHAQVLTGGGNSFYIDPVSQTDSRHYLAFYRRDMNRTLAGTPPACGFKPTVADNQATAARLAAQTQKNGTNGGVLARSSGPQLKTYRLALSNTPEYAVTKGNTASGVMAGKVATVNRVVGVYEKELAVRLVMVANNSLINFLSGTGTQPSPTYSNSDGSALLSQNQSNIDRIIGSANYDIGHVVSTGGGGIAGLGVVCSSTRKAQGVTGSSNPVGDAFDIDYVAHEMGHQFGGNHPFNGNAGSCAGGNRNASTAFEPGSGSTIMAYAGICTSTNDLQPNSDAIFHTGNYDEMRAFIEGTTCGTSTATGNTAPTVTAPAGGKTLPIGTPFKLTATATDAESDPLTYLWEELDLGPQQAPNDPQVANQNVPLFRSFVPSASGTRYFPRLSNLVNNTTVIGERLPTVTRTLKFRCTARDQHSGSAGVIGGVNFSTTVSLSVSSTAGPFVVTAPNTAVSWTGGSAQTVTWNVAGTTAAPVSCATVNIRLSLDGGLTYPTVLASNVANTGSVTVTAPNPATTQSQARIMVEAADNYFFDISNTNFTISPSSTAVTTITGFTPASGPVGTVVTVQGSNFTGATAVRFNGTLASSFAVNSATQLTATVAAGTTTGPVTVVAPAGTATSATSFTVTTASASPTITSFSPTSGPVGTSVVITGTNLSTVTQVSFNGTNAPTFTANSSTQLTATVPAGATTGTIAVVNSSGTGTSATSFVVSTGPANDLCANATPLSCGQTLSGTTVGSTATGDPTGSCTTSVDGGGVFYTITGTGAAITLSTCSASTNFDTKLFVYTGSCGAFTCVAGNDDVTCSANSTASAVTFTSVAGTVYRVFVSGYQTAKGTFAISATCATPPSTGPANDLCANATPLSCGQTLSGTTVGSTATGDPTGSCTTSVDGGGVFYTITGTGAAITLSTCSASTGFDTKLFVYTGACGSYTCVVGNDDTSCSARSTASAVTFNSVAGTVYRVFVSGYQTAKGAFAISAACTGAKPAAQANAGEFSVWPNPVAGKGALHVALAESATNATATLRSMLGQVVATSTFSGSTTDLSVAGLATGTYLLTVQAEGQAPRVQRVVVE
ncbi:hypothetical protein GCM10022409_45170 [Hymenobacter glaciei]|uniref:IPT/TIG domain-containing protein n=1 Tax=Hymenobacter glaciei TaxID=877209 RepID=A0ABP7UUC0_9BACT